ncbi:DEAD/DEAH box helicase [uncultured Microscilla sp.]|uniref:DEAD/DEAH box helicase n=1 Tax=uncultured Microscilla sp. TaxID=432653 RepID=UPI002630E71B|nr:DEAD/DEAH box helicase [uncultured Microscilla sp.]
MELFDKLKQQRTFSVVDKKMPEVFFLIDFDEYGAYLAVVGKDLLSVDYDYTHYTGYTRDILRSLQQIEERQAFNIDWEKNGEFIYLFEHDYLFWQLKYCDNVIDIDRNKLSFYPNNTKLILEITTVDEQKLRGECVIKADEQILKNGKTLSENYLLANNTIYSVEPIGNHFNNLSLFDTTFNVADLEKYLSLFFSYFQNIDLEYEDYKLKTSKELVKPQPSLFFEKIDEEHALYLRVSQVLPNLETDFLENYDVNKLAQVNEVEETIVLRTIEYSSYVVLLQDITKQISGRSKKKNLFYQDNNLFVIPQETAEKFIRSSLPALLNTYQVFGAEKLKAYKIKAVQPKLNIHLSSGIDFLEGDISVEVDNEQFSLFDVIKQYNKQRYLKLNDGTQAVLNEKYIQRLERLFKKQKDGKVKVSFFDLPMIDELIEEKIVDGVMQKSREVFAGFNKLSQQKYKKPTKVKATLRSYQQQGVKWLSYLHKHQLGGCLADDMGLGKTLQTITLLSQVYPKQKRPTLIVMPRTLLFNWANEIDKFNASLSYYTYYANNRDLKEAVKHHLIFTTYATLRNDIETFKEQEFYYVVLDESQNIKNLQSQTSKAVMLLNAEHRLALSGTPVENNLTELYALFRFLNPSMFGSVDDFNKHYTAPIQQNSDKEVSKELRQKIYPFILRRLKKNVLTELPPKVEQVLYVDMGDDQKTLYHQRRQHYYEYVKQQIGKEGIANTQFYILQALTELRQLASVPEAKTDQMVVSAKREMLIEQVLDAAANGHKILIFVNFLQAIESISEDLQSAGIEFVSMTGATQNRQGLVDRFQNDKKCRVFLMTLKTGGVGLNLTAADMVYIYDPWWNTSAENQAIDRTYRMGQDKTVFSYKLITKGTIEEKILQLQNKKKELFDSIITSDSASIKSLNEDDIEFILA